MFFIGIFGIESKEKGISSIHNIICPLCKAYGRYEVIKSYQYFHFFFIPLWRWNVHYYLKTHCCIKICEIEECIGKRIENGEEISISVEQIKWQQLFEHICPHCKNDLQENFQFCPFCGLKL